MILKKELGQFYTTNSGYITQSLLDVFPADSIIVDPFAGYFDLLKLVNDRFAVEAFDLDPRNEETIKNDSLLNPPDYTGKWILTNPPFLAKNKSTNNRSFLKYPVDDLYKVALLTIADSDCLGGVIILPLNFFSGDDSRIRIDFLSRFKILRLNIFEETTFSDTTIPICAFSFVRSNDTFNQSIPTCFFPSLKNIKLDLKWKELYTLGYAVLNLREDSNLKVSRLQEKTKERPSNLYLRTTDTGTHDGRISLTLRKPFVGKVSDRSFATICFNRLFSDKEQKLICHEFNERIEKYRAKYNSLFLTNFRGSTENYTRKRISFELAYRLISNIVLECIKPEESALPI